MYNKTIVRKLSNIQKVHKLLIIIYLFVCFDGFCQPDSEELFYRFQNSADNYEQLLQYYAHPIPLNKTNPYEIRQLGILSQTQINSLFKHIRTYGKLISIYELQTIKYFDHTTIQQLLPYVTLYRNDNFGNNRTLPHRFIQSKNHTLLMRYDRVRSNALNNSYLGSPYRLYIRYRNTLTQDFSLGFTLEKDIGEKLAIDARQNLYLFDFQSFHLIKYNIGKIKKLLIGDYTLNIGQGLILGNGLFFGKSSQTIVGILKNTTGIVPYTATTESGFMRGIATTLSLKKINLTLFYSNQRLDNKRSNSGLHRTQNELNNKAILQENLIGYHLTYQNQWLSLGQTFTYTKLSDSLDFTKHLVGFQGNRLVNVGSNFLLNWRNIIIGGEWATNGHNRSLVFVGSILISLSKSLDISLLYRGYDIDYQAFYARTFSERTNANNEIGNYLGIQLKPSKHWLFNGYIDIFHFPWLTNQTSSASNGYDLLLRGQYRTKKHYIYFQYRFEQKEQDENNMPLPVLEQTYLGQGRLHIEFKTNPLIRWKTRLQASHYRTSDTKLSYGYLLSQTLIFSFKKFKLNLTTHFFETDNFKTRQFIYENDVLYAFSFPSYNGLGARFYIVLTMKLNKYMTMYLKYAKTFFIAEEPQEQNEEKNYWRLLVRIKF